MPIVEYIKTETRDLDLLSNHKEKFDKYVDSLGSGQIVTAHYYSKSEMVTLQQMRYYRGCVLMAFVNEGHFTTQREAHIHFGNKFLLQVDMIDTNEQDFWTVFNTEIAPFMREDCPILSTKRDGFLVRIEWVKSTGKLKKKEKTEYIESIKIDGAENYNIYVPDANEYLDKR